MQPDETAAVAVVGAGMVGVLSARWSCSGARPEGPPLRPQGAGPGDVAWQRRGLRAQLADSPNNPGLVGHPDEFCWATGRRSFATTRSTCCGLCGVWAS